MAVLADFSKAFDTVAYGPVLKKLHKREENGLSKLMAIPLAPLTHPLAFHKDLFLGLYYSF